MKLQSQGDNLNCLLFQGYYIILLTDINVA